MKLPKGWEIVSLEKVAKIQTGLAKGKKDQKNVVSLPYLRVANVQDGYLDLSEIKEIEVDSSQVNRYLLQNEDILLTEGGDFDKLGRGGIWHCQINPCLHQNHVFAVRVNRENLIPYFFAQQVSSFYGKAYFLSCAKQTTNLASINSTQLKKFPVLLPPLLEQCKIVEILGIWDESIDLLERLIGKTRSRKQGLMQQLLTGKKRFKEFEGSEWKIIVFNQIIDKCFDYRGRTPLKIGMEWGDGNIPALSASNVRMGKIDFDRECYFASTELYKKWMTQGDLEKGDVLLTTEAPLGTVAQVPDNELYILSQRVIAIRPKPELLNKSFLFHSMISKEFQDELDKNSSGSTAKGIQRKRLEKIIIKIPSLPEQEKIAAVLSAADEEISTLEKQLAAYKQQKLGLMQQLLTGKIRV